MILRWNNRVPTKEIVWHLLIVWAAEDINHIRRKVFRFLKEHGIVAIVCIELTCDKNRRPNDTVHFHFLLDDPRSEDELRELFNSACLHGGQESKQFRIDYRPLDNGDRYFEYFVKHGTTHGKGVILFEKGTGLDKFYQIGKWFRKPQNQLWEDYKAYLRRIGVFRTP